MAKTAKKRKKVVPIPAGYHSVTAYLAVSDGGRAIDFYKKAFAAKELLRMAGPGGKVGHAEVRIGDSHVMLADEHPNMGFLGPQSRGGTTVQLHLYVKDVDATVEKALAAGATLKRPLQNQFYGDRTATVEDPFGHVWYVATHVEDVPPKEIARRAAEEMKKTA